MSEYYEKKDLSDFANIGEYPPELKKKYFDYYSEAMKLPSFLPEKHPAASTDSYRHRQGEVA